MAFYACPSAQCVRGIERPRFSRIGARGQGVYQDIGNERSMQSRTTPNVRLKKTVQSAISGLGTPLRGHAQEYSVVFSRVPSPAGNVSETSQHVHSVSSGYPSKNEPTTAPAAGPVCQLRGRPAATRSQASDSPLISTSAGNLAARFPTEPRSSRRSSAHERRHSTRCLDPAVAKEDGPVCPLDYGDVDRPIFSHRQNTLCTRKLLHHINLKSLRSPVGR